MMTTLLRDLGQNIKSISASAERKSRPSSQDYLPDPIMILDEPLEGKQTARDTQARTSMMDHTEPIGGVMATSDHILVQPIEAGNHLIAVKPRPASQHQVLPKTMGKARQSASSMFHLPDNILDEADTKKSQKQKLFAKRIEICSAYRQPIKIHLNQKKKLVVKPKAQGGLQDRAKTTANQSETDPASTEYHIEEDNKQNVMIKSKSVMDFMPVIPKSRVNKAILQMKKTYAPFENSKLVQVLKD